MKISQHILFMSALMLTMGLAQANSETNYTVPFHHAEIKPASKIYVKYSFDSHKQTLICTSSLTDDAITTVNWHYKDADRKIELPVTLKDDSRFEGHFADPSGRFSITNEFGSSQGDGSISVSCEYKEMR